MITRAGPGWGQKAVHWRSMEAYVAAAVAWILAAFALPSIGLSAIFVVSLVSATLLPLGSEPVVYGYVLLTQAFWPAVLIATLGNTLGGMISYGMGGGLGRLWRAWVTRSNKKPMTLQSDTVPRGGAPVLQGTATASKVELALQDEAEAVKGAPEPPGSTAAAGGKWHAWCVSWLKRLGPRALFFSWLPAVGDPLCAVAGYLRFAFWPSVFYMAIGKFLRYTVMTAVLLWVYSGAPLAP